MFCVKTWNELKSDLIGNTFSNYFTKATKNLASKVDTN